jgi:hypothetical protein
MPLDTSIYQNLLRPPKTVQEYDNEAQTAQTNALGLQMARAKMAEQQRGIDQDNALAKAYQSAVGADGKVDRNKLYTSVASAGLGAKLPGLQKSFADADETAAKTAKQKAELIDTKLKQSREYLATVRTPEEYIAWHEANHADPVLGPELAARGVTADQARASIMKAIQTPGGFEDLLKKSALGIEKFTELNKPTIHTQNLGGVSRMTSVPGLGGVPTTLSESAITQSADSRATERTAAKRLAFDLQQATEPAGDTSDATVDLIGQGKMAPPSGMALRNPQIVKMMERVAQKYPDYDATEYAGKIKAMRDFSTGKEGSSIRSFAVASDHLKQLDGLVDALANKDVPLVNKFGNIIAQQTGSTAPTNFDAAKGIVAKEVLKSIVAGGGGVEERQELAHLLDNAKTEKQLKGVIQTYQHLMEAQKEGLMQQYELATGRKDAKTRFDYSKKEAAAPAPTNPKGWALHVDAKGNKAYVSPDGKQFEEVH